MKRLAIGLFIGVVLPILLVIGGLYGVGYFLSPQSRLERADAIVAISGGDTEARAAEAMDLYRDGYSDVIIFSGAALDPKSPSNAAVMGRMARQAGIPTEAIILDERATNTRGNASGVRAIIEQKGYESIILVTSPYHQRRAGVVFSRALGPDVRVLNHSSLDATWRRSHWWDTPQSRRLTIAELQKTAYEVAAGYND